jgi:ubiquinol-cytochrome c reductase cytochrome b subunit
VKAAIAVIALVAIVGMLPQVLDAKFWGVVFFGSVVILAFLPWLDKSPVKSIRYRPSWHKYVYAVFFLSFLTLGYLGTLRRPRAVPSCRKCAPCCTSASSC